MPELTFHKYHALGNDYLVFDCEKAICPLPLSMIPAICHRHYGIGSDGILVGPIFHGNAISLHIYNPDGSEAEKSGNGLRIFARYLFDAGYVDGRPFQIETKGGTVGITYLTGDATQIAVQMGTLQFTREAVSAINLPEDTVNIPLTLPGQNIRCTCVSIGNPHCVVFAQDITKEIACQLGSQIETAPYFPKRINTQFVRVLSRSEIQIEIFERGAGYTLASGSSACAAAGAAKRLGLVDSPVSVRMPGGTLTVSIDENWGVTLAGGVSPIGVFQLSRDYRPA